MAINLMTKSLEVEKILPISLNLEMRLILSLNILLLIQVVDALVVLRHGDLNILKTAHCNARNTKEDIRIQLIGLYLARKILSMNSKIYIRRES